MVPAAVGGHSVELTLNVLKGAKGNFRSNTHCDEPKPSSDDGSLSRLSENHVVRLRLNRKSAPEAMFHTTASVKRRRLTEKQPPPTLEDVVA